MSSGEDESERLHRRLERERRARRQAEIIAERGMRELWAANAELRDRVTTRTAELECSLRALELTEHATSQVLSGLVDRLADDSTGSARVLDRLRDVVDRTASRPRSPTSARSLDLDPVVIADRLVEHWQHPAARSGQLLSVEVAKGSAAMAADWALVQAVADVALDGALRRGTPGALTVTLSTDHDGVRVVVRDGGPAMDDEWLSAARRRPLDGAELDDASIQFALLDALTTDSDAAWEIVGDAAGTTVTMFVPAA